MLIGGDILERLFLEKSLVLDQSYVDTIINNIQNNFYELANRLF